MKNELIAKIKTLTNPTDLDLMAIHDEVEEILEIEEWSDEETEKMRQLNNAELLDFYLNKLNEN